MSLSKQQKLEFTLKNAIATGNKSKAAWAIVQIARLQDLEIEQQTTIEPIELEIEQPVTEVNQEQESEEILKLEISTGNFSAILNAEKTHCFGYFEIESVTEKAIKFGGRWFPKCGIVSDVIGNEEVLRFRHWYEAKLTKLDYDILDKTASYKNSLQIDKTKGKIEVSALNKFDETEDSNTKVFFIKVNESTMRIRKTKFIGYFIPENRDWLTGVNEARIFYKNLVANGYVKSQTKFADF